jgi:hypothetical protein
MTFASLGSRMARAFSSSSSLPIAESRSLAEACGVGAGVAVFGFARGFSQ